ncbi:MAG: 2-C-methyl-D-erythritol 4-phosphate cytidylyltransferase [Candidatus Bathyarchaeia archaeon]
MVVVKAVILAAGKGERMLGTALPKQFIKLKNKPLLAYTLNVFQQCNRIDGIVLVTNSNKKDYCRNFVVKRFGFSKVKKIIVGGETRQESSYNGIKALENERVDIVVIHDAARPFVNEDIIVRCIEAAEKYGASDVCVKATDTVVKEKDGFIEEIPDRSILWYGQTPQAFKYRLILAAHEKAKRDSFLKATDDASLVLRLGHKVKIVEGSYENIKITNPIDLKIAEKIIENKREDKHC